MLRSATVSTIACILLAALATACGAEDPKEGTLTADERDARRDKAVDLAGTWATSGASGHPSTLTVVDEADRYDVRATFAIGRELTPSEESRLRDAVLADEPRIDDKEIAVVVHDFVAALQSLVLGEGETQATRGGENVALDGEGKVSELALASRDALFHETRLAAAREEYHLTAALYATAHADGTPMDYLTTRNTDADGQSEDRKGLVVAVRRDVKDGAGGVQQTSQVIRLWLELEPFAKR
jgi:hypothetical protein